MRRQVIEIMVEHGCATCHTNEYRYTYIVEKDGKRYSYPKRCSSSVTIEEGWEDTDKPHKGRCVGISRCLTQYEMDNMPNAIENAKEWCYKSILISVCANNYHTKGKVQMFVDNSSFFDKGFIYVKAYIYLA